MGIYLKPTPPHSGLTALLGGDSSTGEHYHLSSPEHGYVQGIFSGTVSVSATTFYSAGTDLNLLFQSPQGRYLPISGGTGDISDQFWVTGYTHFVNNVHTEQTLSAGGQFNAQSDSHLNGEVYFTRGIDNSAILFIDPTNNDGRVHGTTGLTFDQNILYVDGTLSANTIYSGGTNLNDLLNGGSQYRTIYVAKNGNNTDGSTASRAFTTLSAAVQYYTSNHNNASATNPFTIKVVDTGVYSLSSSLAIPNYVAIDAQLSDIYGPIVLGDGSKLWVKNHYPRTNADSPLVTKSAITTTSYYKADVVDARGSGGTGNLEIVFQSSGSTGQMFLDIKKLYVTTKGIGSFGGTANGHIHLNIEDLYLARNSATAIRTEGGSGTSIVGYVHHILESGGFSNTLAFELAGGRISIISTEILVDTFAYVVYGLSSQLDIVCPYINVTTQYASDLGQELQIDYLRKNIISSSFPSQMMSGLTAGAFYANSASAVTFFSGSTDVSHLLGQTTYVQPGLNITTGGTATAPIVNVAGYPIFTAVTAVSVSATTFYSGSTNLSHLLGQGGQATYVQPGINITTGGTPTSPIVNVAGSIVLTAVTADSFYSGATPLNDFFVWKNVSSVGGSIEPVAAAGSVQSDNSIAFGGTIGFGGNGSYAFGRNASILDSVESSGIFAGDGNTIQELNSYSIILGGLGNNIGQGVFASAIIAGEGSSIGIDSFESFIIGGSNSIIQGQNTYSSVFGGVGGIIEYDGYASTILGGINNRMRREVHTSTIIGGMENLIFSGTSGTTILGGLRLTGTSHNTVYVPNLNLWSAITSAATYILALQDNGNVTKMLYSGAGTSTYLQNGNQTTTGGTEALPRVDLVASPRVNNLIASGLTYSPTFSGGTFVVQNQLSIGAITDSGVLYQQTGDTIARGDGASFYYDDTNKRLNIVEVSANTAYSVTARVQGEFETQGRVRSSFRTLTADENTTDFDHIVTTDGLGNWTLNEDPALPIGTILRLFVKDIAVRLDFKAVTDIDGGGSGLSLVGPRCVTLLSIDGAGSWITIGN